MDVGADGAGGVGKASKIPLSQRTLGFVDRVSGITHSRGAGGRGMLAGLGIGAAMGVLVPSAVGEASAALVLLPGVFVLVVVVAMLALSSALCWSGWM